MAVSLSPCAPTCSISLDRETPEEDAFVYNMLLSLQPFLGKEVFKHVEPAPPQS